MKDKCKKIEDLIIERWPLSKHLNDDKINIPLSLVNFDVLKDDLVDLDSNSWG